VPGVTSGATYVAPHGEAPTSKGRDFSPAGSSALQAKPADFVCEEDVRLAIRQGHKIVIGERSIVTPAARDLGNQHRVFVDAAWPR
jgi:hypothetical protein